MASPFPGMDPYLEAHWRDVHVSLLVYIRDALRRSLPTTLSIRAEQRIVLKTPQEEQTFYPDVKVVEHRPEMYRTYETELTTVAKPLVIEADPETITEGFLQIVEKGSNARVVTVLEVLSPTNKSLGEDRDAYIDKQRAICRSETNLVEIDLLRGGKHTAAVTSDHIPEALRAPYLACVRRATTKRKAEVYPIPINEPLPTIAIPLRPTDRDVELALQPLIARAYEIYEGEIDYNLEPVPPFAKAEAEWADKLLREKGVRTTLLQPKTKPVRKKSSP